MIRAIKKRHLLCLGLLVPAVLIAILLCWPGQDARAGQDLEGVLDGRNLKNFDGVGRIDRVKDDQIVINDSLHRLSRHVKYYRQGRKKVGKSFFRPGARVGYVTNGKGEIISLYLIHPYRHREKPEMSFPRKSRPVQ